MKWGFGEQHWRNSHQEITIIQPWWKLSASRETRGSAIASMPTAILPDYARSLPTFMCGGLAWRRPHSHADDFMAELASLPSFVHDGMKQDGSIIAHPPARLLRCSCLLITPTKMLVSCFINRIEAERMKNAQALKQVNTKAIKRLRTCLMGTRGMS